MHPALAVAVVCGLLTLVALGSRGHSWSPAPSRTRHLPIAYWDYIFSGVFVLWLALGLYSLHRYLQARREGGKGSDTGRMLRGFFLLVFVILLITVIRPHIHRQHAQDLTNHRNTTTAQTTTAPVNHKQPPPKQVHSHFRWQSALGVALLMLAAAGGYVGYRWHRRRVFARRPQDAAAALAQVLDDTLDDLRNERDPRRAVIAAYARMERTLAAHGLPRASSEAPEEYLHRMLAELDVSGASARRLTALFERAKFSTHDVDAGMKEEAIDALVALRAELLEAAE